MESRKFNLFGDSMLFCILYALFFEKKPQKILFQTIYFRLQHALTTVECQRQSEGGYRKFGKICIIFFSQNDIKIYSIAL